VRLLGCFCSLPDVTVDEDSLDTQGSQVEALFDDIFMLNKEAR